MPGLPQRNEQFSNVSSGLYSVSGNGFWSKHSVDVGFNQLQKFWKELSLPARQKLLRIDKHTLFEQARKNMYCSRCNGLLLEGFLQIVIYGKSLQTDGGANLSSQRPPGVSRNQTNGAMNMITGCQDEIQDPAVHPWGGLTTTREGSLTLLDCYLCSKSLKGLQNVFDSARARERERELLYPDACGGGGRGWISQGIASYGRGHGTRETCALHTARLSCDTLVDFWSALGEETRQSLLRMKEEDFIERLMYRFDSKRFCRDCRRNVIREFKELKELKRMRREQRCTSWFCAADTAFQYEVSDDMVQADWRQTFADSVGTYHHFEWAVGTGEGKSDILEFENVGMNESVQVNGLDLSGLTACFITLRAWKMDGRCSELSVKAHALKGRQCVHCRLIVGDGFVTITRGESIRRFFEHAEETEEEEDDDSMEKDGNELDGECSRPQKHAKSPELAREFLLDAATVIFKEQVEKAFREGTARQNAHSIFVCLALNLLEERIHVACKEIITLEKQMKLLEEEEKEKREEEERKERRRLKEREKKLRRKERLKGKERDKDKQSCCGSNDVPLLLDAVKDDESSLTFSEEQLDNGASCRDSVSEAGDNNSVSSPGSPNTEEQYSNGCTTFMEQNDSYDCLDGEVINGKDGSNGSFTVEQSKSSRRRLKCWKEVQLDSSLRWSDRRGGPIENPTRSINGSSRQLRISCGPKSNTRNCGLRFSEKFNGPNNRIGERYDFHSCKLEPSPDMPKQFYRGNKHSQADYLREGCGRPKNKGCTTANSSTPHHAKKVWEPLESQKKYPRSNSDSDFTLRSSSTLKGGVASDSEFFKSSSGGNFCGGNSGETYCKMNEAVDSSSGAKEGVKDSGSYEEVDSCPPNGSTSNGTSNPSSLANTSISDNSSSCLSEGDSITASLSSNHGNLESSSTSDSEDASQQSEGRETPSIQDGFPECHELNKPVTNGQPLNGMKFSGVLPTEDSLSKPTTHCSDNGGVHNGSNMGSQHHQGMYASVHNHNVQYPVFQAPSTMGYYHQNPVSWPAAATMPFHHPNQYLYASPMGYSLNGNSRLCVPYGPMQHVTTPVFNPSPTQQAYQPVSKATGFTTEEWAQSCRVQESLSQEAHGEKRVQRGKIDNFAKLNTGNNDFSLFQFGWPLAPSKGEGAIGDGALKVSAAAAAADRIEQDSEHNKRGETVVEEYNLFAASKSIKFSFF
ncbi:unnamed protein product [Linum trigynum]|uniref:Uncharacterized protein n=1 Tax=Linum trigynum TaxID=586398 RepID=A0AAV2DAN6_9ROSI